MPDPLRSPKKLGVCVPDPRAFSQDFFSQSALPPSRGALMAPKRQGPVERRVRAELRAAGWSATLAGPLGTIGMQAIDMAQTQDWTESAREKSTLNRELRMTMVAFREALAAKAPAKGDAVDDAADEPPGGAAGTPDPGAPGGSNVLPFGAGRSSAG
ncbi:hypothetical protein [Blastococcus sp. CT_GayMR16]|uniref:hypothetical protein n=1 Tax=Blastococcus sp. CT_GayMR16 TaxID=2559607 RepID=UPI0010732D91|nr:hypothetical protein [Blastococcus sp. CT_GayMR16]TFV83148.1 hypothetical protein E4P38_21060 [Blastococcus sp. CT_GayMR16]